MKVMATRDQRLSDGMIFGDLIIENGKVYDVEHIYFDPRPTTFLESKRNFPNGVYYFKLKGVAAIHSFDAFIILEKDKLPELPANEIRRTDIMIMN
jgi:hypothetical protein